MPPGILSLAGNSTSPRFHPRLSFPGREASQVSARRGIRECAHALRIATRVLQVAMRFLVLVAIGAVGVRWRPIVSALARPVLMVLRRSLLRFRAAIRVKAMAAALRIASRLGAERLASTRNSSQ